MMVLILHKLLKPLFRLIQTKYFLQWEFNGIIYRWQVMPCRMAGLISEAMY